MWWLVTEDILECFGTRSGCISVIICIVVLISCHILCCVKLASFNWYKVVNTLRLILVGRDPGMFSVPASC